MRGPRVDTFLSSRPSCLEAKALRGPRVDTFLSSRPSCFAAKALRSRSGDRGSQMVIVVAMVVLVVAMVVRVVMTVLSTTEGATIVIACVV